MEFYIAVSDHQVFQLLLPECVKGEVLKHLHNDHGHQGVKWTPGEREMFLSQHVARY